MLVLAGEGWHPGVIGIVAARITERFGKPSILISINGEEAKGSGRASKGFSLFEAVCSCSDLLVKFGGHPMAAGLKSGLLQLRSFERESNVMRRFMRRICLCRRLRLTACCIRNSFTIEVPRSIRLLEPFGTANPAPLFGLFGVRLQDITPVGGGKHLRLTGEGQPRTALYAVRVSLEAFPHAVGDFLDLAVTLDAKPFNGKKHYPSS